MADEKLQKNRIVKVEFEFTLPVDAGKDEILSWISMELGFTSSCPPTSLADRDIVALGEPRLTDTGLYQHEKATPTEDPNVWTVKRWREPTPFEGTSAREVMSKAALARYSNEKRSGG